MDDIITYYGTPPIGTIKALVLEEEGEIKAIWGAQREKDCWYGFANINENVSKRQVALGIRAFKKMMQGTRLPLVVLRDKQIESSERFLKHLGMTKINDNEYICRDLNL